MSEFSLALVSCIAAQFAAQIVKVTPLGNGLINDTYLVETRRPPFVLQKINHQVFPKPELIMANLRQLNRHIAQKYAQSAPLAIPELLRTISGAAYYLDSRGEYWRALSFIDNSESLETIRTTADAEQAGFALGCFHRMVNDLNPQQLQDTLPGFHITPGYLKHYRAVKDQPVYPPNPFCTDFISRFENLADDLETARQQGWLPLRIIHGDPKLNNFLFDKYTGRIISLIDLDTVKPGLVHYDIGDCLRSCCHELATGKFDLAICAAVLSTYLEEVGSFFTEQDYEFLYPAIRLIPFELGIRFYTDYLEGNRYFKVTYPEQNLERAAQQFELCADIINQKAAIITLIRQLRKHGTESKSG